MSVRNNKNKIKQKILLNLDRSKMTELSCAPEPEEEVNSIIMVKASCLWGDKTCLPLLNIIKRDGKEM